VPDPNRLQRRSLGRLAGRWDICAGIQEYLEDIERRLREIVDTERSGIERRLSEAQDRLSSTNAQDPTAPNYEELTRMLQHLEQMGRRNQNFLDLQKTLTEIEEHIQLSRRYYNATVRDFNTKIQVFPNSLIS